jgi:hypothetical protein
MKAGIGAASERPYLRRSFCAPLVLLAMASAPPYLDIHPTMMPWDAPLGEFWQRPAEVEDQDLFEAPWDRGEAPDPADEFRLVSRASHGGPEVVVTDGAGRQWAVRQMPDARAGHGSIEVVLSRVLSALGYHQPPVYFLRSFVMRDADGVHEAPGGRFRRQGGPMLSRGTWSWEQNPFVGMFPYQGLLVTLLMFNASDLASPGNAQYDVVRRGDIARWYVLDDLAATLGPTGLSAGDDEETFAGGRFITRVVAGYVEFDCDGPCRALVRDHITADDVGWASFLLGRLSDRQWHDAFRAGGYDAAIAGRFIATIRGRIAQGRLIGGDDWP